MWWMCSIVIVVVSPALLHTHDIFQIWYFPSGIYKWKKKLSFDLIVFWKLSLFAEQCNNMHRNRRIEVKAKTMKKIKIKIMSIVLRWGENEKREAKADWASVQEQTQSVEEFSKKKQSKKYVSVCEYSGMTLWRCQLRYFTMSVPLAVERVFMCVWVYCSLFFSYDLFISHRRHQLHFVVFNNIILPECNTMLSKYFPIRVYMCFYNNDK